MHFACSAGSLEAVKALLRGGEELFRFFKRNFLKLFLFKGVDTSLRNENGKCAIDLAKEKGFDGVVSLLQDEVDATQMLDSPRDLKVSESSFLCVFVNGFFRATLPKKVTRRKLPESLFVRQFETTISRKLPACWTKEWM